MNDDREWEALSSNVFIKRDVKAPAFLWTRILAAIEEREAQLSAWWRQWRWMSRLATAMTLLVSIATGIVIYEESQGIPLETLLQGVSTPQTSVVSIPTAGAEEITTAWLVEGGSSWEQN